MHFILLFILFLIIIILFCSAQESFSTMSLKLPVRIHILDRSMDYNSTLVNMDNTQTTLESRIVNEISTTDVEAIIKETNDIFYKMDPHGVQWNIESVKTYVQVRDDTVVQHSELLGQHNSHYFKLLPKQEPYHPRILNVYFVPFLGNNVDSIYVSPFSVQKYISATEYNTSNILAPPIIFIGVHTNKTDSIDSQLHMHHEKTPVGTPVLRDKYSTSGFTSITNSLAREMTHSLGLVNTNQFNTITSLQKDKMRESAELLKKLDVHKSGYHVSADLLKERKLSYFQNYYNVTSF